jgi:phosphatidylglycerol---prolipoprotein diacylglyceryl transferase
MFPTLLKIGSFEITTFGLMMFLGFVVGGIVLTRQFRKYGLKDEDASNVVLASAIGGILGAKIYYAILYRDLDMLFSRAGLVWYGGLMGGALAVSIYILWKKLDYFTTADAASPALAIGYALGRVGCFLVGDDYGRPTDSAIGVAFPKGAPPTTADSLRDFGVNVDPAIPGDTVLSVHPTQLYEAGASLAIFALLLKLSRRPHGKGWIFGLFLVLAGIERFLVEILRAKDDRFLGPFTVAQLISVLLIFIGVALMAMRRARAASV